MKIPNFIDTQFVDKEGKLSDTWRQILAQLFNELQRNTSQEGLVVPEQVTTNIFALQSNVANGSMLYDSNTNELKAKIDGVFKVIQAASATFSEDVPGLSYDPANAILSLTPGYVVPTTADAANWNSKEPAIATGTGLQYWRGDKTWQTLNTSVVPELTNLYYTDTRSRLALSSSATGLTYTNATGDFSLTSGYIIPTTTEESNWNSTATIVGNATSLDTSNTLVLRDSNGRTAVSLSDDTPVTPRVSLDHNNRFLIDQNGHTSIDWNAKLQYGLDDRPLQQSHLQIDYQNSQLSSWYKYAITINPLVWGWADFMSLDWKQCQLFGADNLESLNWDGHYTNFYGGGPISMDYGGGGLWDANSYISMDWVGRQLYDSMGVISGDYNAREFYDVEGRVSVAYEGRYLADKFGNYSVDWGNYVLTNSGNIIVVDWSSGFKLLSASTGSGAALLGANSPSAYLTAPYTWVDIIAPDGTACAMPIWKK